MLGVNACLVTGVLEAQCFSKHVTWCLDQLESMHQEGSWNAMEHGLNAMLHLPYRVLLARLM
jgi:hypothetical protein